MRDTAENNALTANVANPFSGLLPNGGSLNNSTTALANLLAPYPEFPVGTSASGWNGSGGVLEQDLSNGRSYYHSLNFRVQKRLSHGISVLGNYAWSKMIEQDTWLNATDAVPEKRVSPFDHPEHFVAAITYDIPVGRNRALDIRSRWLDAIVGGWHLNSVYTWQLGAPLVWTNGSTTAPAITSISAAPAPLPPGIATARPPPPPPARPSPPSTPGCS